MNLQFLKRPPFQLTDTDVDWVQSTLHGLSIEDRVRQTFVLVSPTDDVENIERLMRHRPGGVHRMPGENFELAWRTTRRILELAEELSLPPPLISGDLEGGGHGFGCMTPMPNQMALAAAKDPNLAADVVRSIAREAKALGFNWSLGPVLDINANLASAIVGTRSYGSDVNTIKTQGVTHIRTMQAGGLACAAKHWPGDGYDARDQHLVTSINPLDLETWEASVGSLYRAAIDAGAMSIMSGHIAFPAWATMQGKSVGVEPYRPASLSADLNLGLLRGKLGFNGLIVSDATLMAGLGSWSNRRTAVPQVIENGCDVFLFSKDEAGDIELMLQGVQKGYLSEARLEAAVARILGLKAALGLHRRSIDERLPALSEARAVVGTESHRSIANRVASASITLVKDVSNILPIDAGAHKRVVIVTTEADSLKHVFSDLVDAGFEVRRYKPDQPPTQQDTDLVLYLFAQESMLTVSRIYIDWRKLQEGLLSSMERYWHDIPTIMVSFGHPYHLFDAPRVPCFINAYTATVPHQHALVRGLLGKEVFSGTSPVDAFCGLPDAAW